MNIDIQRIKSGKIVALTGAGVSAESGMPTFRSKDALWEKYRPEDLATPIAFARDPELVWKWYSWRLKKLFSVVPNAAHLALAKLEDVGLLSSLITQNVDDLHERAGSEKILKLHGSIVHTRCISCGEQYRLTEPPETIPICVCNGFQRPDVVWFGESLKESILKFAFKEASVCNTMLVIGTSAVVYPAAALPQIAKENNAIIIEFNINETPLTPITDFYYSGPASETVPAFLNSLN